MVHTFRVQPYTGESFTVRAHNKESFRTQVETHGYSVREVKRAVVVSR